MLVFICGFMGSGKTFLLTTMKNNKKSELHQFIDLDDEIYERFADFNIESSLADFIENRGWDFFREKEKSLISEYCFNKTCLENIVTVISLGGGALALENLKVIKNCRNSSLVWLNTPFGECLERIEDTHKSRPLLKKGEAFLHDLFRKREENYLQADLKLSVDEQLKIKSLDDLLGLL